MLRVLFVVAVLAALVPAQTELEKPFAVRAGGVPIDVTVGHAAPYFVDMDGDGLEDLLVGQFGQGQLRIYRNTGKPGAPAFAEYEWFQAGGDVGRVPAS